MTDKSAGNNGSANYESAKSAGNYTIDEIVAAVVATLHAVELNCPVEHEGTISDACATAASGKISEDNDLRAKDNAQADSAKSTSKSFMCSNCKVWNTIQFTTDSTTTWYVVTKGTSVGVFQGWHLVGPLVIGVSSSKFMKCSSERAARTAYNEALKRGLVEVLI